MRYLDAAAVSGLGYTAAAEAIRAALLAGVDPAADPARTAVDLAHGQLLLMPSQTATAAGVKVVTVAPGNPDRGLPRIHATYVLFDNETLAPVAILDGTALTTLRTPAVSVAAVVARLPDRPLRLAVIGSGPQALGHAAALGSVRELAATTYLVRDPGRSTQAAVPLASAAAEQALRTADVVVGATSARGPLFDSTLLREDVVVIAVGSHQPDAREFDGRLLGRATVVVEDIATALREAGDVVLAIEERTVMADDLVTLRDVVTGRVAVPADRPLVFKSVGMGWEDLVVARAVVTAAGPDW